MNSKKMVKELAKDWTPEDKKFLDNLAKASVKSLNKEEKTY